MNAVEATRLTFRHGRHFALGPLDLEVAAGERLAVLGENGAGKTTLLRLLATVDRPGAGELRVLGLDPAAARSALRARIGYLGHDPGLYPHLTARENLEFFCSLRAVPRVRAEELLEAAGCVGVAGIRAADLSRGMRQRLALTRSLLHDPELWILDEPDSSLDEAGRRLVASLAAGRTLVLATHDAEFAASTCSRRLRLEAGRLAAGPRLELAL